MARNHAEVLRGRRNTIEFIGRGCRKLFFGACSATQAAIAGALAGVLGGFRPEPAKGMKGQSALLRLGVFHPFPQLAA